jgi:hypothetical protein
VTISEDGATLERRRILVLGCSGRKRDDPGLLPAVDRYDSPQFRVMRRYLGSAPDVGRPEIFVVSAEYGLIRAEHLIASYDRRMTPERSRALQTEVVAGLVAHVADDPADVLISCAGAYAAAVDGLAEALPAGSMVQQAPPRPGERLACLHDWLYGASPAAPTREAPPTDGPVAVQVRGARATLTAEDLLERGRQVLAWSSPAERRPSSWVVDLDGTAVSPKWLVGVSFDLRRSAFGTSDALRVLAMLSIPVRRLGS